MIIYNNIGDERCEIHKLEYSGAFMGERFITASVKSPYPIEFAIGDYIDYRGERFTLNYDPSTIKKAGLNKAGDAFTYDSIKFNSYSDELVRCEFLDYVLNDNLIHFSSLPTFGFHALTIQDLADRIKANLDRIYTDNSWTINVNASNVTVSNVFISVDKQTVWGALALVSSVFKSNFIIRGREITIGTAGSVIDNVFEYGKGNGLNKITRVADPQQQIITRLRVYGSTRNLPSRYYNKLTNASSAYLPNNMAVRNLMLPSFPYDTLNPYLDSPNISVLGVMEGSVFFDGSNDLPEIYPSLEGMTAIQLINAGVPVSLDEEDNGNLDEIVSISNEDGTPITDDGLFDEGSTIHFKLVLKDVGFNLWDYRIGELPVISLKDGMNGGREFEILSCVKEGNKYVLICNRIEDVGRFFPYASMNIKSGDKFVLLNIEMPEVYIKAASQRLLTAGQEYLSKNDYVRYTYEVNISPVYMAKNPLLKESIIEGDYLMFSDTDLNIDGSIIIDTLRIKEGDGLSTYEVTLTEEKQVGTLQKLQNQINYILSGSGTVDIKQTESLIKLIGNKQFLSKVNPDTASSLINFAAGLTSKEIATLEKGWKTKDFVGGLTGVGANVDSDGKAELDALTLRKWLEVPVLRYNRAEVTIGDTWKGKGAGVIESVDTANKTFTLKLEEGEFGTFEYDDICIGIYHSSILEDNATSDYDDSIGNRRFAGFSTCYFRVIQVLGSHNEIVRYELRPQSANFPKNVHPFQFMTAVAYGNFTNADRQASNYQTTTYTRYLRNVRDWEFSLSNIAAQFGNLSNLNIFGLEMSGYSIYLNNVYFTGIIHQLSEQIQEELSKQKVGGKNLLRESDFRFDFKYWGGTGEYIDVDITTLRNAPKLSVSPTSIAWVYPECESDINVTSNTNWNIE